MSSLRLLKCTGVVLLLLSTPLLSSCGSGEEETAEPAVSESDSWPYPGVRGSDVKGEKNFAYLINNYQTGRSTPTPWAGFWWPYGGNGIAGGKYTGGMSPAGKYDAARGRTTNAQSWEVANHGAGVPKVQPWWGHCNGWSAAAALFEEPRSSANVNGVTFDVADIKALLTEAAMEVSADYFGERVDWAEDYNSTKLYDTVPDQYFLVLTNYMGRLKQGVLMDRYTVDQVWNQPIPGYQFEYPKPSDYLGADPQAPNVYRILLTGTLYWARDDVTPDVLTVPFNFEINEHFDARTLQMEIWLDGPVVFGPDGKIQSSGNVIVSREGDFFAGGVWKTPLSSDAWPDYMWVPYSVLKPTEYANPFIDIEWIRKHILVPGGADDPSVHPSPVETAPPVRPSPSSSPTGSPTDDPWPFPTWSPTTNPTPWPTSNPTPWPTFDPTPFPTSAPTAWPTVVPRPTFSPPPLPIPAPTGGRPR